MSHKTENGTLYVVATPIGNLEDITLRALRILKEVDLIAVEDTRRAKILLNHYQITTPVTSFYSAKQKIQAASLIEKLLRGASIALITEAGSPGISDPGHYLVAKAHEAGIKVIPIPGPSALVAALMASGMNSYAFTFYGFLPPKGGKRRKALNLIASSPHPVVIYESPWRLNKTLKELHELLGERKIFIGREMTKFYEEYMNSSLTEAVQRFETEEPRGEFTIIIMTA